MICKIPRRCLSLFLLGAAPIALAMPVVADAQPSSKTYTYDPRGRLVVAKTAGGTNNNKTTSICYDKMGNRTQYVANSNGTNAACVNTGANTSALPPLPPPPPAPSISIVNGSGAEGGNVSFTVTLSAVSSSNISVSYATANGSAVSGDYNAKSGTVTLIAGQISQAISVSTKEDTLMEGNETFIVNLSGATGGATIADGQAVGTILDDDFGGGGGDPPPGGEWCGEYLC